MLHPPFTGRLILVFALICLSALLGGCEQLLSTEEPDPILVTLPVATAVPASPTSTAGALPADTPTPYFPQATEPVPPTPIPQASGVGSTRLLWEWREVARPSALAASGSRLAVIIADGRFAWLDANTGLVQSSSFLWPGILQGESWGEVYVDELGTIAVAAIREQSINPQTGLADSRARLAAYDSEAGERWSLPELGPQHFYSAALTSISVVVGKWPQGFRDNTLAAYELYTGEKLWEIGDPETGYEQIVHDGNRLYVLLDNDAGGAVAAFDLRTGEELWRWFDPEVLRPDRITLGESGIYLLNVNRLLALDPATGETKWSADLHTAPEAGLAARGNLVYLVPSPAAEMGFRPGLISLYADGSGLAWHALAGLLADPLALGDEALWTVVKDYDTGLVALSGLDPETGLERVRVPSDQNPAVLYQLVAHGRRVYVLGDSLLAYGY